MLATLGRFALALGVALVVGEVAAAWAVGDGPAARLVAKRQIHLLGAWLAVLTGAVLLFVAQGLALELAPTAADVQLLVRETAWGHGWTLLAVAGVAGTLTSVMRAPLWCRGLVALGMAVVMGGLGHAAADDHWRVGARATDAAHVLGMGAWLGALLWLHRDVAAEVTAAVWRRYSRMASLMAPLVALTGLVASWRRVASAPFTVVLTSDYGRLLTLKAVMVGVVLALGAWHRRALQTREAPGRWSVRGELLLALGVLAVTSVLTGTAPPAE